MISQVNNALSASAGAATSSLGSTLGALMNLVPTPGKLVMIPVEKFDTVPIPTGPPYIAMFNPENWQTEVKIKQENTATAGQNGAQQNFNRQDPPSLSFDLIIDGTGASGETREVLADVMLLEKLVLFNGKEHQPNKVYIIWGTQLFQGVATKMSTKYTLFRPNGTPLRATVSFAFKEDKPLDLLVLAMNLFSSDLTTRRLTKNNDRLDLLCHYVYKDSRHYLEVARANELTSFRKLPIGSELIYPPVSK